MDWQFLFSQTNNDKDFKFAKEVLEANGFKKTFKIFNVVGTNGKGSVSSYLAQGFRSQGLKVGLFNSPHLIRPNERISINGKEINDEEFEESFSYFKDEGLNFFTSTYVVAMMYFMVNHCDVVILEAGIGGSKDSTNAIDGDWGCITNVSLDHTEILGDTIEKITADKIGIYNPGMKFFYPSRLEDSLKKIIKKEIPSAVQIDNDAEVYRQRNQLFAKGILNAIGISFDKFEVPRGRTETFTKNGYQVTVDVAHNYDGIKQSLKQIEFQKGSYKQVVISLKKTKNPEGIVKMLGSVPIFVYQKNETFFSAKELGGQNINNPRRFFEALDRDTLFIGSFHLAGEVLDAKDHAREK